MVHSASMVNTTINPGTASSGIALAVEMSQTERRLSAHRSALAKRGIYQWTDGGDGELAEGGRTARGRTGILQVIGNALLVQQRVAGRVAIAEKPDALWEKPELERLYSRLKDEYELKERLETLDRKLSAISGTANALTDIVDPRRSLRLEWIIVVLIVMEVGIGCFQIITAAH
ncbi:putative Rmd1/YagE family protein [Bradyrhizobium sp. RT5a]